VPPGVHSVNLVKVGSEHKQGRSKTVYTDCENLLQIWLIPTQQVCDAIPENAHVPSHQVLLLLLSHPNLV